jgi:DNA repair protein RadC
VNGTTDGAPNRAAPAAADFLAVAQNQKTPAEVLEQIVEHPALAPEVLIALLRHPHTPGAAMARLTARAAGPILDVLLGSLERLGRWVEALEALLRNPNLPPVKQFTIRAALEVAKKREADGARRKSLLLQVKELPVAQKLALAKKGNKDVRMILVRDSNEMVALETVSSSRISDGEILAIAMMRDVAEQVLRYIANNRKYRQNKQIILALLNNPRTPVGVSLGLSINSLTDRELADLSKNKNVPGVISRVAQQILDRRKGPSGPAAGGH